MQTTTQLHTLLLRFRNESGALTCSVSSAEFGSRVDVGRPTTLSADDLMSKTSAPGDSAGPGRVSSRFLSASAAGYSVSAEFDSEEAADDARWQFDQLVREITGLVSNPPPKG
jgi:hypothetical protein